MKSVLSDQLAARAFKSTDGERAWCRDDLPEVLKTYSEAGVAVEAFEVWVVNDQGQWNGFFPTKDCKESICVYDVQPRTEETIEDFAKRCAGEIWQKITEINIESHIAEGLLPWVRYNLYVEEEYKSEQGLPADAEDGAAEG
jgi:hypothetical protein